MNLPLAMPKRQNMLGYVALELISSPCDYSSTKRSLFQRHDAVLPYWHCVNFGWRLMRDVTGPIRNMVNTVDRMRSA